MCSIWASTSSPPKQWSKRVPSDQGSTNGIVLSTGSGTKKWRRCARKKGGSIIKRTKDHFRGCLVGGAIGDALGWPVEFLSLAAITGRYGPDGISDLPAAASGRAQITDDTQMTLFTAEGILRSRTRRTSMGNSHDATMVFFALQRWLVTQGYPRVRAFDGIYDGWLLNISSLHECRAPGGSCLSALSSGTQGTIEEPINNRKGCGGVMRAAPAGLFYPEDQAFAMGAEFAALTHGHPSGYLSSGALADLIARLIAGRSLTAAVEETLAELRRHDNHAECTDKLSLAMELADSPMPDREAIARIGEGWVGEEALAIAVYCALKYPEDFKAALIAAVNHDGDSDSTGAITGNILGAWLGLERIPPDWIHGVELEDELLRIADDLLRTDVDSIDFQERYPGH